MENKSLYWWIVYVFLFVTFFLMMVHIVKDKSVNYNLNYAVSFVNKKAFMYSENAKKNIANDTVDSMAIFKKLLVRNKFAHNVLKNEHKTIKPVVKKINPNITSKVNKANTSLNSNDNITPEIKVEKYKESSDITSTNSNDSNNLETHPTNQPSKSNSANNNIKIQPDKLKTSEKQIITIKTNNSVTENTVYQGLYNNDVTYNNQTNNIQTKIGNPTVSNLINAYSQNLLEIKSMDSKTENVVSLDLTNNNLVALNQIGEYAPIPGTYNGPMHAIGNGAGQDGFDAGGGTDNTITYNDTAAMGSLPIGEGTKLMILFALCYLLNIIYRQNYKYQN
ncbi:MAG: hypothetical protein WCJ61_14855 [Paludibacter sp.]